MEIEFKILNNFLEIILTGKLTAERNKVINTEKIKNKCKKRGLKKVLINASDLSGDLNLIDRFNIAKKFAQSFLGSNIKTAILSNKKIEYPNDTFFETVAINRGAIVRVFRDITKAKKWLLD